MTDISADTVVLTADTGIGENAALELASVFFLSADTDAGAIDMDHAADFDLLIVSMTTSNGDISFDQTGNFDVFIDTISADTVDDTVTLTAEGSVEDGTADDQIADIVAANISITTTREGIGTAAGTSFGPLDVNATVSLSADSSTDGSNIFIDDVTGDMPVGLITAGAGDVTLTAASAIEETAAADAEADIVGSTVNLTALDGGIGAAATIEVDVTGELNANSAASDGAIDLSDIAGDLPVGVVDAGTAGTSDVTLASVGAVTDTNADTLNITGDDLIGTAADAIDTTVVTALLANNAPAGADNATDINLLETDTLIVNGATQSDVGVEAVNSGDIHLETTAGDLTIAGTVAVRDSGNIELRAGTVGDVFINDTISITVGLKDQGVGIINAGDVEVESVGADVIYGAAAGNIIITESILDATNGTVSTIQAGTATVTAADDIFEADATEDADAEITAETILLTATGGAIGQGTDNDITESLEVDSGAATLSATAAENIDITETEGDMVIGLIDSTGDDSITLTTVSGGIEESVSDAAVKIDGGAVALTAVGGGIGANGTVDIESATLTADSTDSNGNIDLSEVAAGVDIDIISVNAGTGDVTLNSVDGAIVAETDNFDTEIIGANISLTADDGGIGTDGDNAAGNSLDIDATVSFSADTAAGDEADITVDDVAGDLPIGLVTAGMGTVTLDSVGEILDATDDTATDIAADTVVLTADSGIGATRGLELASTISLDADVTAADADVSVNSLTTPDGNITYTQTGTNFDLLIGLISADTDNDTVTLTAAGAIDAQAAPPPGPK